MIPGFGGYGTVPQGAPLAAVSEAHLTALSQQGNASLSKAALMEQQSAQQAMQMAAEQQNIEVPKVNFYPSRHPNPQKARKKDIKQAYKLLRPTKRHFLNPRRWWFGGKYRYNKRTNVCVVDGCDCEQLIQYDNLYARITDEDTDRSLYEAYWTNTVTGEPEAFIAREKVTGGRKMHGTYCPEHLHLYHLLCKWEAEEEKEVAKNPRTIKDRMKKGVSTVAIPVAVIKKENNTPPMIQKYEHFFAELEKDSKKTKGIDVLHYQNPATGLNDVTMIVFDLRIFQEELKQMETQMTPAFQQMMQQQVTQQLAQTPAVTKDEVAAVVTEA